MTPWICPGPSRVTSTTTRGRGEQNVGVPDAFTVVVWVAVSVDVPAVVGVTTSDTVAVAPTAMLPSVQVTVGAAKVQDPWFGVAEAYVAPACSVSVTVTFVAVTGPALDTVKV